MAWKETARAAATLPRCRYQCDVCELIFEVRQAAEAPPPDCPACSRARAAGQPTFSSAAVTGGGVTWQAPMPAINTTKAKAMDLAEAVMADYGMTDMNDNQRAGDIAFKGPAAMTGPQADDVIREMVQFAAQTTALPSGPSMPDGGNIQVPEAQRHLLVDPRAQVDNFFQGVHTQSAEGTIGQAAAAKAASDQARAQGADPVGILETGRQSGSMPLRLNVVGEESQIPEALVQAQARTRANPQMMPPKAV